jgi:hypothetical protein
MHVRVMSDASVQALLCFGVKNGLDLRQRQRQRQRQVHWIERGMSGWSVMLVPTSL